MESPCGGGHRRWKRQVTVLILTSLSRSPSLSHSLHMLNRRRSVVSFWNKIQNKIIRWGHWPVKGFLAEMLLFPIVSMKRWHYYLRPLIPWLQMPFRNMSAELSKVFTFCTLVKVQIVLLSLVLLYWKYPNLLKVWKYRFWHVLRERQKQFDFSPDMNEPLHLLIIVENAKSFLFQLQHSQTVISYTYEQWAMFRC